MTDQKPTSPLQIAEPAPSSHRRSEFLETAAQVRRTIARLSEPVAAWLHERAEDLTHAQRNGFNHADAWIKASVYGLAAAGIFAAVITGIMQLTEAAQSTEPRGHTGLLATITLPVVRYLEHHTQGLPLTAETAYGTWTLAALVLPLLACVTRSFGARLAWGGFGAGTVAMVWFGTAQPGRPVAAAVAFLGWALISIVALRGFHLSRGSFTHTNIAPEIRPEIHIPAPRSERAELNGHRSLLN